MKLTFTQTYSWSTTIEVPDDFDTSPDNLQSFYDSISDTFNIQDGRLGLIGTDVQINDSNNTVELY
jgi:hypothetical protein